jgi:DNA-binding response OmpR family regulator
MTRIVQSPRGEIEMADRAALVVEDEDGVRRLVQTILGRHCTSVDVASDGEEALTMLQNRSYDVVVLDLMLPKVNGLAVSEAIQAMPTPPAVIVLSAISRYFADRLPTNTIILQKPFDIDKLDDAMQAIGLS